MKIVYCIHSLFNSGGMERIVISKANYLAELGHDVIFITTEQKHNSPFFDLNGSIRCFDLGVNYSNDNKKNVFKKGVNFIVKQIKHKRLLSKLLYEIKPHIVISTFGNEASFLPDIKDGSKKILEIHFSKYFRIQLGRLGMRKYVDIFRSYQDGIAAKRYDKFVVLTDEDKKNWGGMSNIIVIPNFVNIPTSVSNVENKVCIAVGRLSYQKNFECLLDIWKIVNQQYPDWNLHIYGNGDNWENLMCKIEMLELSSTVTIYEPTSNIDIAYLQSSIYLLTSRYEGLPMVLLEAMSLGLPPIAFACKCGPRDLINNGVNGFLIGENDIDDFSKKMMLLMGDFELRMELGKYARLKIENYTKEVIMQKWSDLFISLNN